MTEDERIAAAQAAQSTKPTSPLEAAKARLAKAEEARRMAEEAAEVGDIERQAEAEEALAQAIAERGKLGARRIDTVGGPVVLRRGQEVAFKRWLNVVERSQKKNGREISDSEMIDYIRSCMVYPVDVDQFFAEFPGARGLCSAVNELYGIKKEDDLGK